MQKRAKTGLERGAERLQRDRNNAEKAISAARVDFGAQSHGPKAGSLEWP